MSAEDEVVYTADQVAAASTALRAALALPPEHFGKARFIGMISDEIERLRAEGWDDDAIAALVRESTGSVMDAEDIARHFVTAERRRRESDAPA